MTSLRIGQKPPHSIHQPWDSQKFHKTQELDLKDFIQPHSPQSSSLTAIVIGAGPGGDASAIRLRQAGFNVLLADKRTHSERDNFITIRPSMLNTLDELGALKYLEDRKKIHPIDDFVVVDEVESKTSTPPASPAYRSSSFKTPKKLSDERASHIVRIKDLEIALTYAAEDAGVQIVSKADVELSKDKSSDRYQAKLTSQDKVTELHPDLIVWASGSGNAKNMQAQLGISTCVGVDIKSAQLPEKQASLKAEQNVIETQQIISIAIKIPSNKTRVKGILRKHPTPSGKAEKTLTAHLQTPYELQLNIQLPRKLMGDEKNIEKYVSGELRQRFGGNFTSLTEFSRNHIMVRSEINRPFSVQSNVAERFVAGSNVLIVGDAGGVGSPIPGIGTPTAVISDANAVYQVGLGLSAYHRAISKGTEIIKQPKELLEEYTSEKSASWRVWAEASRSYFLTQSEATSLKH